MPSVAASERGRAQTGTAYEQVCAAVSGLYDLDGGGYRPLAGLRLSSDEAYWNGAPERVRVP
jgi:hypothetical protein